MFITLNYHISATFHTISKINFRNFTKSFLKKILTLKNYFAYKDPIPNDLKSFLVYQFTCASCNSTYIDETCCHFKTRIEEHIKKDNKSHIFKHLHSFETCFEIIDKANSKFVLKIKEALHINWRKPNSNAQQNHLALTLSL